MNINGAAGDIQPFPVQTWEEFQQGPDRPDFLIDGILERGRPLLLAGPFKSLKTRIADDLAYSMATGTPALGMFATGTPARVLLVSGETPREDKRRSLKVLEAARGHQIPAGNLIFADEWFPRLPLDVPRLVATMREEKPAVIIIDPAYRALGAIGQHAPNMFVFGDALFTLSEAAGREGCATVILHHANDSLRVGQRPELSHVAYSGFAQWARCWFLVNRLKKYADGSGKHELLVATGGAGRSDLWHLGVDEGCPSAPTWGVSVSPVNRTCGAGSTESYQPGCDNDASKVEAFLKKHPDGQTKSVIRDTVKLDTGRTEAALNALVSAGLVEPCTVEKPGKRAGYDGYRVVRPQRSERSG